MSNSLQLCCPVCMPAAEFLAECCEFKREVPDATCNGVVIDNSPEIPAMSPEPMSGETCGTTGPGGSALARAGVPPAHLYIYSVASFVGHLAYHTACSSDCCMSALWHAANWWYCCQDKDAGSDPTW